MKPGSYSAAGARMPRSSWKCLHISKGFGAVTALSM